MAWRLTFGFCAALATVGMAAPAAAQQLTPAQFSALPPGAPLNPHPRDLPMMPTVQLGQDFEVVGGVGDAEGADPFGGGYGYGGNVYMAQPPNQGFPLPRVRPIRPPDLRPPPIFRQQMQISPPATGGLRVQIASSPSG